VLGYGGEHAAARTELVRRMYEAFTRGDLDAIEPLLDRDVEYHNPEEALEPGVRRGPESFLSALRRLHESFEYRTVEAEQMVEEGDDVVVVMRIVARGKTSGAPVEQRSGQLWRIRDGRLVRLEWFRNADEAFEAAGLERPPAGAGVELLRRGYEALARGDRDSVLQLLDPQIEVHDRPESPDAGVHHGHQGVREALNMSDETFDDFELVPQEFVQHGNHVVVVLLMRGQGRESGVPVEEELAHLWTFEDEKAMVLRVFSDPADAVAAAKGTR
jgi:ketosteroid isomerase-like protein